MSDSSGPSSKEYDCEKHEIDLSTLPGYSRCPKCVEEERIRSEERHYQTRDPTKEPY